jgi:diphosphoinositol-polyphosphate diphosphatase
MLYFLIYKPLLEINTTNSHLFPPRPPSTEASVVVHSAPSAAPSEMATMVATTGVEDGDSGGDGDGGSRCSRGGEDATREDGGCQVNEDEDEVSRFVLTGNGTTTTEGATRRSSVSGDEPLEARTGRANQRYNAANQRLVAGCICYRRRISASTSASASTQTDVDVSAGGDVGTGESSNGDEQRCDYEVLMLNSKKGPRGVDDGRDLIFPKGGWETDETSAEAAARESMEEGGVRGRVSTLQNTYEFVSRSRVRAGHDGDEAKCVAHVFTMEVEEELERWPEERVRTRHWLTPAEAWCRCKHDWMRDALKAWTSTLKG